MIMIQCSKDEASNLITKTINDCASQSTLLLLSGGSSAGIGIGALAGVDNELRNNLTVMLADERFVDYDSSDSNGNLLRQLSVSNYCHEFIETLIPENSTLTETVALFQENITHYANTSTHIIALFGIGVDNHIAGILPDTVAAASKESIALGYETEKFTRITISPKFFDNITNAYIYAEGKDKQEAIDAIEKEYDHSSHPSQLVKKCIERDVLFNKEKL